MTDGEPTEAPRRAAASSSGALELVVIDGAEVVRLPLRGESRALVIGRGPGADLTIGAKSVSKRHARIHVGSTLEIEDLGSANGTFVGGKALALGARAALASSSVFLLGDVTVLVRPLRDEVEAPPTSIPEGSMAAVWQLVDLAAPSDLAILVLGETGVGKEIIAQAIHERSRRARGPLMRINCAAIPETMLESELFGHEKGAFTGAGDRKIGLLEAASGGTVVFDEVGELALGMQAKLLRAIDASEILRLGAVKPITIDVRVVASTNRDLSAMIAAGTFRRDLYHRLDGLTIHVPPLRNRRGQISTLADELLRAAAMKAGGSVPPVSLEAMRALVNHPWPGNVRELKKVVERALVLAKGKAITVAHLRLDPVADEAKPGSPDLREERERAEKRAVQEALAQTNGNQTRAAALLGISRRTLVERLDKYDLPRPRKS